jgi:hypothetical protein
VTIGDEQGDGGYTGNWSVECICGAFFSQPDDGCYSGTGEPNENDEVLIAQFSLRPP